MTAWPWSHRYRVGEESRARHTWTGGRWGDWGINIGKMSGYCSHRSARAAVFISRTPGLTGSRQSLGRIFYSKRWQPSVFFSSDFQSSLQYFNMDDELNIHFEQIYFYSLQIKYSFSTNLDLIQDKLKLHF